jgi:hypothetical protein
MYIYELISNQKVTIIVRINEETIYHTTQITQVFTKKRMVLAMPIYQNGKVLSFQAKGLTTDILAYPENDAPQLFKDVTITLMKRADQSYCYLFDYLDESAPYNRRQYYRCHVRANGTVQTGLNPSKYNVTIMDVSLQGYAFTCPEGPEFILGQEVTVEMKDYMAEYDEQISFVLKGVVVRSYVQFNGGNVYGCRMDQQVTGLDVYIMKKERLRLRPENHDL